MQGTINAQGLRKFARTRTQLGFRMAAAAASHPLQATHGFQCPQENETIALTPLHKKVEEPVHSVIQIDIGSPCLVLLDEPPGAGTEVGMTGRVVCCLVGLCLDNHSCTTLPLEPTTDQLARSGADNARITGPSSASARATRLPSVCPQSSLRAVLLS